MVVPKAAPQFVLGEDQQSYYSDLTIDDFSPLVTFPNDSDSDDDSDDDRDNDDWDEWTTHWEDVHDSDDDDDNDNDDVKPINTERQWALGTYMRTDDDDNDRRMKIEFWGSELKLFGDQGPAYGAYSLRIDDQPPTMHTAFQSAQATGRSRLLHDLRDLGEGRHELTVTVGRGQPGNNQDSGFLFDYAVVKQKVGRERTAPTVQDDTEQELERLVNSGSWRLTDLQEDLQPGLGGVKQEIFLSRVGLATTDNLATLTRKFQGSAVQVYGGRNASHGAYRATLTDSTNNRVVHSKVYRAHAPCDVRNRDNTGIVGPACDWRGSVLKFAAADLDPSVEYDLTLQNLHRNGGTVLEVDMIRVIGAGGNDNSNTGGTGGSTTGGGTSSGGTSGAVEGGSVQTGAGRMNGIEPMTNFFVLFMTFLAVWRSFRH